MLRLQEIATERRFTWTIGDHVLLKIEFPPIIASWDDSYYWRAANGHYLLEIRIDARSGEIVEVGVVLVPKDRIIWSNSPVGPTDFGKIETGHPQVDTGPWLTRIGPQETGIDPSLRMMDEPALFKLVVSNDGVALAFDGQDASMALRNGGIDFLFSAESILCGLVLRDQTAGKLAKKLWVN